MSGGDRSGVVSRREFVRGAGAAAGVAAASGAASAQGNETGGNQSGGNESDDGNATGASAQGTGGGTETVQLVDYAFEPGTEDPLTIPPGTTVRFVWETDNHNIVIDSKPEGSGWEGHESIENSGFETEHTFETEGTFEFHCDPHENLGMVGTIEVTTEAASAGEAGEEAASILPDAAKTLGIATTGALASVLALAYFFLKYGGDYGDQVER